MKYLFKIAVLLVLGLSSTVAVAQRSSGKKGKRKSNAKPTLVVESAAQKGIEEANRLARQHGIENPGKIKKLQKASIKYFEARELLESSYGEEQVKSGAARGRNATLKGALNRGQGNAYGRKKQKRSPLYRNRLKALETAYGEELREVLPEG
ncbi:hypothetical protein SAMN04490243_1606 [Robiginitalea myxolifaciens]|uniref:DUF4398 domain-containing protein n=1 Tax=Robiginitalea myxolifaciens TaxID=400055 RepID=A0A1I6GD94_9FLAO|nr:hypothetical protein [Robiginitalea myxolifaciens]SFR40101.1 hypothetical protein SAMN04490243_1606 [Robiginitalea myxolifaciens]